VSEFARNYFMQQDRTCLLVAGAGFDLRSSDIAGILAEVLGSRIRALFIRERRPSPAHDLLRRGDAHAQLLARLVPNSRVADVEVLSREDRAVIGGHRAVQEIRRDSLSGITDVILDMSALSVGISFPIARYLYEACRHTGIEPNFHVMVASHPRLDAAIASIPYDVVDPVRGFSGRIDLEECEQEPKIWLPHLSLGRGSALQLIRDKIRGPVDVCPVVPLSQRAPRTADRLIASFESELYQEWDVDPRNLVYAIEDDPLDLYRTISSIYRRYTGVFSGVIDSHVVLSPSGSKVLAIGGLMAALEYDLPVRYVEAVGYEVNWPAAGELESDEKRLVHVWLHGLPYAEMNGQMNAVATEVAA